MTRSMAFQGLYARLTCGVDRERDSLAKEFLLHGTATIGIRTFCLLFPI